MFLLPKVYVFLKVIVDYKTLTLLLVNRLRKIEKDFLLGGRGVSKEFCFIFNAIRICVLAINAVLAIKCLLFSNILVVHVSMNIPQMQMFR